MKYNLLFILLFISVYNVYSQDEYTQQKLTDHYKTDVKCDSKKAVIGYQIYMEQIPSDLNNVLAISEEEREKQVYTREYDMYLSVDFTADLLFTKRLSVRYKLQIDGTGTYDVWKYVDVDWEKDLSKIGKKYYLGKSWYGHIMHETEIYCDDNPCSEKNDTLQALLLQKHSKESHSNLSYVVPGKFKYKDTTVGYKMDTKYSENEIDITLEDANNREVNRKNKVGESWRHKMWYSEIVSSDETMVVNGIEYENVIKVLSKADIHESKMLDVKIINETYHEQYYAKNIGLIYSKYWMIQKVFPKRKKDRKVDEIFNSEMKLVEYELY